MISYRKVLSISLLLLSSCGSGSGSGSGSPQVGEAARVRGIDQKLDFSSDPNNCGADGYVCLNGRECVSGVCTPEWMPISSDGAPTPRGYGAGLLVNGKFAVTGGCTSADVGSPAVADGATYDPSTDTWDTFPPLRSARAQFSAISTEGGTYVLGGISTCWDGTAVGPSMDVLLPGFDHFMPVEDSGLSPRYNPVFVWTGSATGATGTMELFAFGGSDANTAYLQDGATMQIGTQWQPFTCDSDYCAEGAHFPAIYENGNGSGGPDGNLSGSPSNGVIRMFGGGSDANLGHVYDVDLNTWAAYPMPDGSPDFAGMSEQSADDGRRAYFLTNGHTWVYDRWDQTWTDDTSAQPDGFCAGAQVSWVNGELIAWSGLCDGTFSSVGGRYQPPAPTTWE